MGESSSALRMRVVMIVGFVGFMVGSVVLAQRSAPPPVVHDGEGGPTPASSMTRVSDAAARARITAFHDEAELSRYFDDLRRAHEHDMRARHKSAGKGGSVAPSPMSAALPAAAEAAATATSKDGESVTNTQHAGVDEGGIVKVHGDHLVVLRRGRLFTVRIGDDTLAPLSMANAYGPDVDPRGTWYDEMLVSGDTVVVIGYSYARGGTEVGLFSIDAQGAIQYRATYHLRSNDYFSSRNYASRLVGQRLIFYSPLHLSLYRGATESLMPAVRKWRAGATDADWKRIAPATRIFRPIEGMGGLTLHTVTSCDLGKPEMECEATALMGPPGRVFYVSPDAVYVWMTEWRARSGAKRSQESALVRMSLDGKTVHAARVAGSPVDQFSFLERDGHIHVLLRADAAGDGMWSPEVTSGDVALLRLPVASLDATVPEVPSSRYATLPRPAGAGHAFQNRFVGDYVLYGLGTTWGPARGAEGASVWAYAYARRGAAMAIPLEHGVDRLDALGTDAIVIGSDGDDLHFTSLALREAATRAGHYVRRGASQGELRSHGFFFRPRGERSGLIGLPTRGSSAPGHAHLRHGSAGVTFLRVDDLVLSELGDLSASGGESAQSDGCVASCVDWYGNARPLFLKDRILALLGYELVEGQVGDGTLAERRRVSFAPAAPPVHR